MVPGLPRLPRRSTGYDDGQFADSPSRTWSPTRSASIRRLYEQFDLDLTPEALAAVEEIDREQKPGGKAPTHRYDLADYGLTDTDVRPLTGHGRGARASLEPRQETHGKKRVVVWGTGVVGSMVIAEILRSPGLRAGRRRRQQPGQGRPGRREPLRRGRPTGVLATDSVEDLVALQPDALVHYGPTAQFADENIRVMCAFLRAGIDVCSTAMTPWVWPTMKQNPATWIDPITEACEAGGACCFTTGVDPGFANDLFPMTLMGLCGGVDSVEASRSSSTTPTTRATTRTRWASAARPTSPRCSRSPTC